MQKRNKRAKRSIVKVVLMSLATCLMAFTLVGGTIAWLMTKTESVVNVFTYGDINIKLEETTGENYKMVPGKTIKKDPKITVLADSEDCWVFVKIDESTDAKLSDFIEYAIADGWSALDGVSGVYYRAVDSSDKDVSFSVLKNDEVKVKGTVTKEMLNKLTKDTYPKLAFVGYAVQRDAEISEIDTAAKAWELVKQ